MPAETAPATPIEETERVASQGGFQVSDACAGYEDASYECSRGRRHDFVVALKLHRIVYHKIDMPRLGLREDANGWPALRALQGSAWGI
jgi:hypothetical protein